MALKVIEFGDGLRLRMVRAQGWTDDQVWRLEDVCGRPLGVFHQDPFEREWWWLYCLGGAQWRVFASGLEDAAWLLLRYAVFPDKAPAPTRVRAAVFDSSQRTGRVRILPKRTRKIITFTELCAKHAGAMGSPARRLAEVWLPVPFVALGVGAAALFGLVPALVGWAGLEGVGLAVWLLNRSRRKRAGRIDWDSAVAYEDKILGEMDPETAKAVTETLEAIEESGWRAHVYQADCGCGNQAACRCLVRWLAGVIPVPVADRAVLVVGDRLLADGGAEVLRFALRHERAHLTKPGWAALRVKLAITMDAALLVGIGTSGMTAVTAAAGLVLATRLWMWGIEIACDTPAARAHGAAVTRYWALATQTRRHVIPLLPWWQRLLWAASRLVPTHPPARLRAWIGRRVYAHAQQQG